MYIQPRNIHYFQTSFPSLHAKIVKHYYLAVEPRQVAKEEEYAYVANIEAGIVYHEPPYIAVDVGEVAGEAHW